MTLRPGDAADERATASPTGADATLRGASDPDGGTAPGPQWRRVHRITPVLNAWKAVVALLFFLVWQVTDQLDTLPTDLWQTMGRFRGVALLVVLGLVVVVAAVATLYSVLAWRRTLFAVGAESVDLHTGILFRQQRHARLNRVQAVDVVQPLLGRLFGLAQVRVETAGGGGSNVVIGYVPEAEAQALRNEIMARAAGVEVPAPGEVGAGPVAAAPERQVLEVPATRIIGGLLLSGGMIGFVLTVVGLVVAAVVVGSVAPVFGVLPALLGSGGYLWSRFAGEFGFRSALSPDGIRLRHGLLETRTQTLPPGRVQAVELSQALLWRRRGWWRVQVNVAGYGAETAGNNVVETVLLPVGGRGEALTSLWLVLPDLGVEDHRELLDAALGGAGGGAGFLTSPRRARWVDPLAWRRTGLRITGTAMVVRRGRLVRRVVVVPHERTQSLALSQGPLERRLGLADLHAHSVPGPVTPVVPHLDAELARDLLLEQARRARTARAAEGPEEWMRRVAVPGPDDVPGPAGDRPTRAGLG